jgi:hypothetical protein
VVNPVYVIRLLAEWNINMREGGNNLFKVKIELFYASGYDSDNK